MDNKISIIVPIYNSEKTLKKCLESILNQTYQNIEIILINDGSKDKSIEIAENYKNKNLDKIKIFDNNENKGVAEARNFGIEKVTGNYFLFVDADDYIEEDLCVNLKKVVDKHTVDIIKYKMNIIGKINKKIDGPVFDKETGEDAFNELCFKDIMIDTPCLYLFNTDFFKKNKFKFLKGTYHEDFGLIPLVIVKAEKVISLNIYGYNYVQKENSITRNDDYKKTIKKANDLIIHYDNMIKEVELIKLNIKTKSNIKQYYSNAILNNIAKLKSREKKQYKKEIKTRKITKNIRITDLKSIIKKIYNLLRI